MAHEHFKHSIVQLRRLLRFLTFGYLGCAVLFVLGLLINGFSVVWALFLGFFLVLFHFYVYSEFYNHALCNPMVTREKRKEDVKMLFFLGIVGLWLWLPTQSEIAKWEKELAEKEEL